MENSNNFSFYLLAPDSSYYEDMERKLRSGNVAITNLEDALEMANRGYPIRRQRTGVRFPEKIYEDLFTKRDLEICLRDRINVFGNTMPMY